MEENVIQLAAKEKKEENSSKKKNKEEKNQTSIDETVVTEEEGVTTATLSVDKMSKDLGLKNIDMANPSWDLFLVGFFLVGSLLYGLSLGKDRIIAILMSIYMALAVVDKLPDFVVNINVNEGYAFQITTFIAVFVAMFFLLSRTAIARALPPSNRGGIIQTIVLSFLHVGLIISVALSFMPQQFLDRFSETTQKIFTGEWAAFIWIIAPIIAMIVFGRGQKELD